MVNVYKLLWVILWIKDKEYYICKNDDDVEYRHSNNEVDWKVNREDEGVRISWKSGMGEGYEGSKVNIVATNNGK